MALTRWHSGNREVVVSHKRDALTVSHAEEELASYDLEGRFLGSYDHGRNIRRGLDNSFQLRWRERIGGREQLYHRILSAEEAGRHYEDLRLRTALLLDDSQASSKYPETHAALARAANTTYARLEDSAKAFSDLYGHIPILPPDQYRALVVQATDGCTYNRCTFCTLYRDKRFRVRSPDEFQAHIQDVLEYLGRGLTYRTSVFMGDANAIALAIEKLEKLFVVLRNIAELSAIIEQGGVHAFLDIYTGAGKSAAEYRALKEMGLRRVSLGVESGSENLLSFVKKPGSRKEVLGLVEVLKEAGLSVVVILMVGLGGKSYQQEHYKHSVELAGQLPLEKGDIIYLSQFNPKPEAPYQVDAKQGGISAMSEQEIVLETERWKEAIQQTIPAQGVKVAPYSFQRFLY